MITVGMSADAAREITEQFETPALVENDHQRDERRTG